MHALKTGYRHLVLVLVEPGTVKVAVSSLQCVKSGLVGLALGALVGEGAESDRYERDEYDESVRINPSSHKPGILTPLLRVRVSPEDMIAVIWYLFMCL